MIKFERIFVSLPYTDEDESIVKERFLTAKKICGKMVFDYYSPVCPVLIGHDLGEYYERLSEFSYEQWLEWSISYMNDCSEVWVLKIDGWDKSRGVQTEIDVAGFLDVPVIYKEVSELLDEH